MGAGMKRMLAGWLVLLAMNCMGAGDMRAFTDQQGRALEARLLAFDPLSGTVKVQLVNGTLKQAPITIFSGEDQAFIREWYLSTVMLSEKNLVVGIEKKVVASDRYHGDLEGWQSHYPGMDYDDIAYAIHLENRNRDTLCRIKVEYRIYHRREYKLKEVESEYRSNGSISGWYGISTKKLRDEESVLTTDGSYDVAEIEWKGCSDIVTSSIRLREGVEAKGEDVAATIGQKRTSKLRQVDEEAIGIIVHLSVPLPSGGVATKLYAYPKDLAEKMEHPWRPDPR